jgi:hypothetical protein
LTFVVFGGDKKQPYQSGLARGTIHSSVIILKRICGGFAALQRRASNRQRIGM